MNPLFDKNLVEKSVIVFIGAPLVGKGTQSQFLGTFLGFPVVSSGDVFREVVKSGTALGNQLHTIMSQGGLVPNELVLQVFLQYLADPSFADGFILDGFVREKENLETLQFICEELALKLLTFIYLKETSEEDLITRLKQRLQEYEEKGITPRADDKIDVFQRRWKVFQEKTVPVIELIGSLKDRYPMIVVDTARTDSETKTVIHRSKEDVFESIQQQLINFIFTSSRSLLSLAQLLSSKLIGLEATLSKHQSIDNQTITKVLHAYLQLSLQCNLLKRTGLTRRCVFLVSTNAHKLKEFTNLFDQYGIEVLVLPHELRPRYFIHFYSILQQEMRGEGVSIVAILKEYTSLIRYYAMRTEDPSQYINADIRDQAKVVHLSQLDIYEYDKTTEKTVKRTFTHKTPGYIDLSRATHLHTKDVFGWDDIFVLERNGWSYNQLKRLGLKISSRDMNISHWIQEKIYYQTLTDLKFTPIHASRAIDFTIDVYDDFLIHHHYYNNPEAIQCGILNLFHNVINTGIYFRSPTNRRLKNYWCPGLNAGIPLTPKNDEIHEATYMAHDFGHFGLPDLIFTGKTSQLHQLVYITWRMLSEALTMSIADMAFVDTLVKSGIVYDFQKRAIYPLFVDLQIPLVHANNQTVYLQNLKQIIRANYCYCLLGDDSEYRRLLTAAAAAAFKSNKNVEEGMTLATSVSSPSATTKDQAATAEREEKNPFENLEKFEKKYSAFFIEDFKWTHFNYENMCRKSDAIAIWWQQVQPLLEGQPHMFYTIDEVIDLLHLKDIWFTSKQSDDPAAAGDATAAHHAEKSLAVIETIFEYVIETIIFPLFTPTEVQSKEIRLDRAFRRYLVGQCAIFGKFDFIPESREAFQRIVTSVKDVSPSLITLEMIELIRQQYDSYLDLLVSKNLISTDDKATFSESYPLFDPMYLSYDQDHSQLSLADTAKEILFTKPIFTDLIEHQHAYTLLPTYSLSKQEMFYLRMMHILLEHTEAQITDIVYVTKPGVILLSDLNGIEHPGNLLTFLIAGISIEGSLELIAHKEASVARLTTSKTNAMNLPLYRIFPYLHEHWKEDQNTFIQKQYLFDIQSIRRQYQLQYDQINKQRHSVTAAAAGAIGMGGGGGMGEKDTQEMLNLFNQSNKCTFLCYSMTLQDLHKLFIGRSAYEGNESEMREVVKMMHTIAYQRYPHLLFSWYSYLNANNLAKVTSTEILKEVEIPIGTQSTLTKEAKRLFAAVNINIDQPEYLQLADFRSRITYLSFPKTYNPDLSTVIGYHKKIIIELGHMSVLGAYQVAIPADEGGGGGGGRERVKLVTTKEAMAITLKKKQNNNEIENKVLSELLHSLLH